MKRWLEFLILAVASFVLVPNISFAATKAEKQAEARKVAAQTLQQLYRAVPGATFSNFGMKIFVAGGGKGEGVAVNNKTKAETFMKMVEMQAGLGMGVKKFRLVWVFDTPAAFDNFVNKGWELGGQATAAAQKDGQGTALAGAMPVSPGVWLFQLTGDGVALELTAKGTKYYKDEELN
jgi:lipid-binding SYLF domain-containing protein